jgi:hypothetical protein
VICEPGPYRLPAHVEIAGLAVKGKRYQNDDERRTDQRRTYRAPNGLPYAGGTARRREPVVRVCTSMITTVMVIARTNDQMMLVGIRNVLK